MRAMQGVVTIAELVFPWYLGGHISVKISVIIRPVCRDEGIDLASSAGARINATIRTVTVVVHCGRAAPASKG